jgi:hypothetical protein
VRSVGVVEVGEGVDVLVEAIEPAWQVVAGVELVSPGALGGFDGSVEVGPLWGQDEEGEVLGGASLFELGHELRAAIDPRLRACEGIGFSSKGIVGAASDLSGWG